MGDGLEFQALAAGREYVSAGRTGGHEHFHAVAGLADLETFGLGRDVLGEAFRGAHPAAHLAVFLPAGEQAVVGDRQLVGALLAQLHIEGTAVAADGAVLYRDLGAIRGDDLQLRNRPPAHAGRATCRRLGCLADTLEAHRHVFEIEQVVGNRGVDGDPRLFTREHGGRRQHPGAVGLGRKRQADGEGQGGPFDDGVHGVLPVHGVSVRLMAPSSLLPWA